MHNANKKQETSFGMQNMNKKPESSFGMQNINKKPESTFGMQNTNKKQELSNMIQNANKNVIKMPELSIEQLEYLFALKRLTENETDNTHKSTKIPSHHNVPCAYGDSCRNICCECHPDEFLNKRIQKFREYSHQCSRGVDCFKITGQTCDYQHPEGYDKTIADYFDAITNKKKCGFASRSGSTMKLRK